MARPAISSTAADPQPFRARARFVAMEFMREENTQKFRLGVSFLSTTRAFVRTIEAARLLCAGKDQRALKLLQIAATEVQKIV